MSLFTMQTVTPAKAGVHRVSPRKPTGEIGPSLRWGDGIEIGLRHLTVRLNLTLRPKRDQRNAYDQNPRAQV